MATVISGIATLAGSPTQARVTLFNSATNTIVATQLSDAGTGAWSFTGLTAGTYEVLIVKSGYKARMDGPWYLDGAGGDPNWSNVVSLLHFEGADASTTFTDQTGKVWTAVGNAQIDTAQQKFGVSSGLFDGAGDWIETNGNIADFRFGTGDFTVEGFIRTTTSGRMIFDWYLGAVANSWQLYIDGSGNLVWYSTNGFGAIAVLTTSGASALSGSWQHIAVTRAGTTLRIFIDGVLRGSVTDSRDYSPSITYFGVGAQINSRNAAYDFVGHIDEVRMTKGVARYTANFTVPTSTFPDS